MGSGATLGEATLGTKVDLTGLKKGLQEGNQVAKDETSKGAGFLKQALSTALGFGIFDLARQGFSKIVGGIKEVITEAPMISAVSQTFDNLSASIGETSDVMLDQLRYSTRGMVNDFDLMQATNKFMAMGLASSAEEAGKLSEIATQLGAAMGVDATTAMGDFAAMMANQSIPRLDNFGISSGNVRARIEELMASEEGMTRETAFMTAVLEQGEIAMAKIGDQGQTTAASLARIRATSDNIKASIGEALMPVMEKFLGIISEPIGFFGQAITDFLAGDPAGGIEMLSEGVFSLAMGLGLGQEQATAISEAISGWISWLIDEGIPKFQEFVGGIMTFVTEHSEAFKGALIAIGAVLASAAIVGGLVSLAGLIASLANPITLIIAVVGLLGAAWANDWLGIRTALTAFWEETGRPLFELLQAWLAQHIPLAIETLKQFWLTVLLPAIQQFWNWMKDVVWPLLQELWDWLATNIPAAIDVLKSFWLDTLKPALTTFWNWMTGTVWPLLQTLWDWLATNIPAAIEVLKGFWVDTLWPAIQDVWAWIQDNLFPLFEDLAELAEVTVGAAISGLAVIWEEVLKPAIEGVWSFIQDDLMPIFEDLIEAAGDVADFIWESLGPAFTWLKETVLAGLETVIDGIRQAVGWLADKIRALQAALDKLKVPDDFIPGSPSPFETSLRGILDAAEALNNTPLFSMTSQLAVSAAGAFARMPTVAAGTQTVNNWNLQARYAYQEETTLAQDIRLLQLLGTAS